jgi:hypothetical protein
LILARLPDLFSKSFPKKAAGPLWKDFAGDYRMSAESKPGRFPELFYNYVLELISGGQGESIGAAVYLLVGAAFSGVLH